jgi:hypothetical protein
MASSIDASTSGAGGVITTADNTGILNLKTAGTTAVTIDTSQNVTFSGNTTVSKSQAIQYVTSTTGTNSVYTHYTNTGGSAYVGLNNSTGGDFGNAAYGLQVFHIGAYPIVFSTNATERMRIDSSGNLLVNATSATCHKIIKIRSQGSEILTVQNGTAYTADFFEVSSEGFNGAAAAIWVGKNSSTNRSINAGGTVNASGADYAEYMTKASDFTLAKGDVVGIDANGKLTNVFADAVSFCVKSTDPSYVGGDTWGNEEAIGKKPEDEDLLSEWETKLETARQLVDRIAFAGQVPVNVLGATAGQYIIPVNDNGSIKGQAISNPTFEQYQIAVGKVIAIEADSRAKIIVKVA